MIIMNTFHASSHHTQSAPGLRRPFLPPIPARHLHSTAFTVPRQTARRNQHNTPSQQGRPGVAAAARSFVGVTEYVAGCNGRRLQALEEQALSVIESAAADFQHPVFPCALIAGDVVILHMLHRLGLLKSSADGEPPRVRVAFIDTFHLFQETHEFMARLEAEWGFEAARFQPTGFKDRDDYVKQMGSDLYMTNIKEYDRICKVEPFTRALASLEADCMINGRRRDHGFERAFLEVFEEGSPIKCQPLAYWSFADCFAYLEKHGVPSHPLHAQGYPSVGDVQSTVTVPREKWFEYAGERSGRFQGLTNADGSLKTECGIHVGSQIQEALQQKGTN